MNLNKSIIYFTILAILLMIGVPTAYKVVNRHYENLYKVTNKKIIEASKKCYYSGNCDKKITLEDLYNKNYLEEVSDPVTKVVYNKSSYIMVDENFTFYPLS